MIVRFNPRSEDLQRMPVGPIGPHLRGFAALVTKQNYCNVTGWLKVRLVAKFSRWLQRHRITLKELNEARIDRFLHARWKRLARHVGAVSGGDLYAGGFFTTAGGTLANSIAKWNGSTWSALGSGLAGVYQDVRALAVSDSDVYAGGFFTNAGEVAVRGIAKWDGSSWSGLGSGMGGASPASVWALAVSGADLYAGGAFTTAGEMSAAKIAKWNGSTWRALGSGMNGDVHALAVSGSDLYVGGGFTTAGGKVSPNIAKARIGSVAESITASGSSATIQFSGVVGYEYHVQRTDSLTPPMTWTTLTTSPLAPADDGSLTFTDTAAPAGTAYYRLVQN